MSVDFREFFVNKYFGSEWMKKAKQEYHSNDPFPHIVIDDFLPSEILDEVIENFPTPAEMDWWKFNNNNDNDDNKNVLYDKNNDKQKYYLNKSLNKYFHDDLRKNIFSFVYENYFFISSNFDGIVKNLKTRFLNLCGFLRCLRKN